MSEQRRSTIGLLVGFQVYEGFSPNPFIAALFRGARTAARRRDLNLLAACGIARGDDAPESDDASLELSREIRPAWPEATEGSDFVPVGPWNTDALLVVNPLRSAARMDYLARLIAGGFPVLFVGHTDVGPCIISDSEGGIRQALDHIVSHGHREIAFIAGDEDDPGDSRMRLEAFRNGLREHGLPEDPRRVDYGQHWQGGGQAAMRRILDTGVRFTAVMCSNDLSAVGAARELRERGLRIPWDVAVTGFDDHVTAAAHIPPLASVHYPLEETGEKAVDLLADLLGDPARRLPALVRIPTLLVPRHSCGCLLSQHTAPNGSEGGRGRRARHSVRDALWSALPESERRLAGGLCGGLLAGLDRSLRSRDPAPYETALLQLVLGIEEAESDAHQWQAAISALVAAGSMLGKGRRTLAEELLQRSRISLSESASRRGLRMLFQNSSRIEALGRLAAYLQSSRDEPEVLRLLRDHLEGTGIDGCHVLLFEPSDHDPTGTSLGRDGDAEGRELRFPSRVFPPPGMYPASKRLDLALLPLFHHRATMGYVAFDAHDLDPLAVVVRLVSAALTTARLHAEVLSLSLTDALTGIPNRRYLELIMEKEVERSRRYNRDLAFIMIDIDHFKPYNDDFGHPAGDEALKEVARCIHRGTRRELDVVTRYGGEEFAIILPETSAAGARLVAENVRNQVTAGTFRRPVTVSLGVASLRGSDVAAASLVDLADRALYRAKRLGRNRSEVDETPVAGGAPP